MELLVFSHIRTEGLVIQTVLRQQLVDAVQAGAGIVEHHGRATALGRHASRQAFECAAQLDRVRGIALGEGGHGIAAICQRFEQAFLLQLHQSRADRRSGDAEFVYQREFSDTRTSGQLARQNHFTQTQLRPHGLRMTGVLGAEFG